MLGASWAQIAEVAGDATADLIGRQPDAERLDQALLWLQADDHFLLSCTSPDFPETLRHVAHAPLLMYAIGRRELLRSEKFAVVGSRNPTAQGERDAFAFSETLSEAGLTVVSGLALGIDASAHRGALQGSASTIAVVGTGLDRVYPARNRDLAKSIAQKGLLLSEFALGTPPLPGNFPRRNRIISGLSRGCLVVEAAIGSGSLITAQLAVSQGRDVFAVPGSIHSPHAKGCHALIKDGAKLVESARDILEELQWRHIPTGSEAHQMPTQSPSGKECVILEQLGYDPMDLETLCSRAGMPIQDLAVHLLQLELSGLVVRTATGLYQRIL